MTETGRLSPDYHPPGRIDSIKSMHIFSRLAISERGSISSTSTLAVCNM